MENWIVWNLDVWGHAPDECADYDCPGGDRCEGYQVNDRSRAGTLELPEDCPETAIVAALIEQGFLSSIANGRVTVDCANDTYADVYESYGLRPIFQLERD